MYKTKCKQGIGELNVTYNKLIFKLSLIFLKPFWEVGGVGREPIFHRSVALSICLLERLCFTVFTVFSAISPFCNSVF